MIALGDLDLIASLFVYSDPAARFQELDIAPRK